MDDDQILAASVGEPTRGLHPALSTGEAGAGLLRVKPVPDFFAEAKALLGEAAVL